MAVLVVGAVLVLRAGGGDEPEWEPIAQSPLAGRFFPATAWTGKELVVWGGGVCSGDFCTSAIAQPVADGAAYDPAADTWRALASSPLSPRLRPVAVWAERALIVWGGNAGDAALADGALYDPTADTWRPMAASPLRGRFGAASVWTGRELLLWGGGEGGQTARVSFNDGAAYDPEADTWRRLAAAPLAGRSAISGAWTGREIVVWGGFAGEDAALDDGAAYNPASDSWRPIGKSPLAARSATAHWTGKEVLYWGGGAPARSLNDGAAYDPAADTWRPLAESPLQPRRAFASAWTGEELLIWGGGPDNSLVFYGDGAAYDPAEDRWRDTPSWNARFGPSGVWTGEELLVWGGIFAPDKIEVLADGASYRP